MLTRAFVSSVLLMSFSHSTQAEIQTKTITYQDGDTQCQGYLAWDDALEGKRPGVLVVHEWWGLNDYARERTRQLAELGYLAFAADIYGEGKTTEHPADAGKMAGEVRANVEAWRKRAQAGLDVLKSQDLCNQEKLASIGYCFGGSTALQLAYSGADLDAVVTFHGALPVPTLEEAKAIQGELLINHGADDGFISAETIADFKKVLNEAGVNYQFIAYPGAVHSFTVPTADEVGMQGIAYNKSADEKSWQAMKELFTRRLD